jgi:hypothetical protein
MGRLQRIVSAKPKTEREKTMKKVTCGAHEVSGKVPGDIVKVTNYVTARIGSGMDAAGQVKGRLVSIDEPIIRCYGCSFVWSSVTLDVTE